MADSGTAGDHRRRTAGTGAAAFVTVVVVGAGFAAVTPAAAAGGFRAAATGVGMRMTITAANAPATSTVIDDAAPIAAALVDSLGTSQAFASLPYPGDTAVSAPNLVPAALPGAPTPPAYPFFVSSDYPLRPEESRSAGPELSARSDALASRARAALAPPGLEGIRQGVLRTEAVAARGDDGAVVASSTGDAVGLEVGALQIGRLHSVAEVRYAPDGTVTRRSSLEVLGARVGATELQVTPAGISVAGQTLAVTPDPLRSVLAGAGIDVRYLPEEPTADGVMAAGIRITEERNVPSLGAVRVTYLLGQVSASVTAAASGAESPPVSPAPSIPAAPSPPSSTAPHRPAARPASPVAIRRLGRPELRLAASAPATASAPLTRSAQTNLPRASRPRPPAAPVPADRSRVPTGSFDLAGTYLLTTLAGALVVPTAARRRGRRRRE
jgi:hypothetical protein